VKNLTLLLTFILFSLFCTSQNTRLTEKKWFVIEIADIGGGNAVELPKNYTNFPFASLNLYNSVSGLASSNNYISKNNCEKGFVAHINYNNNNINGSFSFIDFNTIENVGNCNSNDDSMQNFMNLYIAFFENYSTDTFNYHIQDVYGVDNLIIENSNGRRIWLTENPFNWVPNDITQKWYLHKTIINGVETAAPNNLQNGFTTIELDILNYYNENVSGHLVNINQIFNSDACFGMSAIFDFNYTTQQFYLYDYTATLSECGNPISNNFSNQYMNFFLNHLPGAFSYEINNDNLIITNTTNDKAIYGRNVLSYDDNVTFEPKIYPNPTSDYLYIDLINDKIDTITIFSVLGQRIKSSNTSIIDFSSLTNGVYIVNITTDKGNNYIKKITKI